MDSWLDDLRIRTTSQFFYLMNSRYATYYDTQFSFLDYMNSIDKKGFVKLSPSTLNAIQVALEKKGKVLENEVDIEVLKNRVKKAKSHLLYSRNSSISVYGKADIWASHCMMNDIDADTLLILGTAIFGGIKKRWESIKNNTKIMQKVEQEIEVLRNPLSLTEDRVDSINRLSELIGGFQEWNQIVHILYHHQFAWPLLVIDHIPISLPVIVDVKYDYKNNVEIKGVNEDTLVVDQWRRRLRKCLKVAKELWKAKHGNYGAFRTNVEQASVIFDFTKASELLDGIGKIELSGGSADAYFVQIILNRFLGQSHIVATAVTGMIGQPIKKQGDIILGNYQLELPEGVDSKLSYVFNSQLFERIVIPKTDEESDEAISKVIKQERQTAQILYVNDMYTLSDIAQTKSWRQYQYIRHPDIKWALHSYRRGKGNEEILPVEHEKVENVLMHLHTEKTIVEMPADVKPMDVASTLHHINHRFRNNMLPTPPSLSWAFVRILEDDFEQDERFWKLIWNVAGAPPKSFQQFVKTADREKAADQIAHILNAFDASEQDPGFRSPDVLVITGNKHFKEAFKKMVNPKCRPFLVTPILELLEAKLNPIIEKQFHSYLGSTRIILIEEDDQETKKEVNHDDLDSTSLQYLDCLASFQSGFTEREATLLLNEEFNLDMKQMECREILNKLAALDFVRYGQGQYHVPKLLKQDKFEQDTIDVDELRGLSERHYMIGCMLTPYVSNNPRLYNVLSMDIKLDTACINEARQHFYLASKYARLYMQKTRDASLVSKVRETNLNLTKYVEFPNWHIVQELLKAGRFNENSRGYYLALNLLQWQNEANVITHPNHFLYTANAAKHMYATDNKSHNRQIWKAATNKYFNKALQQCEEFKEEEDVNRLHVLTEYVIYLKTYEQERQKDISFYSDQAKEIAIKLINNGQPIKTASAEWIEYIGDLEEIDSKAIQIYKWGIQSDLKWVQLWLKFLGCAAKTDNKEEVESVLEKIKENRHLLLSARTFNERYLRGQSEHAKDRLFTGKSIVNDILDISMDEARKKWFKYIEETITGQ